MCDIPSFVFRVLVFPHQGKLVTVDQLIFTWKGRLEINESTIPLIDQSKQANESLGVEMYTSPIVTYANEMMAS